MGKHKLITIRKHPIKKMRSNSPLCKTDNNFWILEYKRKLNINMFASSGTSYIFLVYNMELHKKPKQII